MAVRFCYVVLDRGSLPCVAVGTTMQRKCAGSSAAGGAALGSIGVVRELLAACSAAVCDALCDRGNAACRAPSPPCSSA